jgi:fimbrial chaperone protein
MKTKPRTFPVALTAGLFWLGIAINTVQAQPVARLAISPERYQVSFDARGAKTQSLLVKNLSNETITVQLSIANWELDQENKVQVIPPTEDSLDQWLVVNPLQVTIPPDTPQTIRWAIVPRKDPAPGEYRAIIFIEEELADREPSKVPSVRMKMRFGIPVYGQVGEPIDKTEVGAVTLDPFGAKVLVEVSNIGNRHARFRGSYSVWPTADFPGTDRALAKMKRFDPKDDLFTLKSLSEVVVLPENTRQLSIEPQLPELGDYTIQLDASFGEVPLQQAISMRRAD